MFYNKHEDLHWQSCSSILELGIEEYMYFDQNKLTTAAVPPLNTSCLNISYKTILKDKLPLLIVTVTVIQKVLEICKT